MSSTVELRFSCSVLLDVKPWDDETDMGAMLKACKTIEKDGLVWGACEFLAPRGTVVSKRNLGKELLVLIFF